jgi:transcriptional regulator with XRE-family HTH domain
MLDTHALSCDLMRALRGARSQPAFSRELGFKSNAAYLWEHGRRHPEVSLFLKAALAAKPRLRAPLARFFDQPSDTFMAGRAHSPRNVMRLVQGLVGSSPKNDIAQQLGIDRTTLGRWCSGKTEPRLPQFLNLVQLMTQRMIEFVALFVDLSRLPSTRDLYSSLLKQRRLAYDLPLSHAVLRCLELEAYANDPGGGTALLARELGLSEPEVVSYLSQLEAAGLVVRRKGGYEVGTILTIDTREDAEQNARLKAFWAREALTRFEAGHAAQETLFSFNLFAVSEDAFQQIRKLHLAYYDQVRGIVESSPRSDRVVLMNLQLMPLRVPGESGGT